MSIPPTTKGARTRERLYTTALRLFQEQGYDRTTMREIAAAADCSLGLAYRYFASKEEFVLEVYGRLAVEMDEFIQQLERGPVAERFAETMRLKFEQIAPYRALFTSLVGLILLPRADIAVLGSRSAAIRQQALASFQTVVNGATDRPRAAQASELATVLYAAHLGLILCWLYDPTPEQRATTELLRFAHDVLALGRRFLRLPPTARLLSRLARALAPIVGVQPDLVAP